MFPRHLDKVPTGLLPDVEVEPQVGVIFGQGLVHEMVGLPFCLSVSVERIGVCPQNVNDGLLQPYPFDLAARPYNGFLNEQLVRLPFQDVPQRALLNHQIAEVLGLFVFHQGQPSFIPVHQVKALGRYPLLAA